MLSILYNVTLVFEIFKLLYYYPFSSAFSDLQKKDQYGITITSYALHGLLIGIFQKQPPRGAPRKRCSENMQQIYRRTPMPKCDFNKVALHLIAASDFWNNSKKHL